MALMPLRIGAVFGKEVRISSRRRRSFVLRFGYLLLLTAFVVLVWLSQVRVESEASAAYRVTYMSEAGKRIIAWIVWFQFIAAQLVAVLLLSTSFSEEMHRGTMGPLLSTPLTSFQIIAGKLMGGLLQVLLLLGISFPLLAVVRVFGGVPAAYVFGSLCMTMTACLFAGAVTVLFSIILERTHVIILASLGAIIAWNTVIALILLMSMVGLPLIPFVCPAVMMFFYSAIMKDPSAGYTWLNYLWPAHCLVMLGFTAGLLAFCARAVRKVASRRAVGESIVDSLPPPPPPLGVGPAALAATALARLAEVSAEHASQTRQAVTPAQTAVAAGFIAPLRTGDKPPVLPEARPPTSLQSPPAVGAAPPPVPAVGGQAAPPPVLQPAPPPLPPAVVVLPEARPPVQAEATGPVRRITGSPILWKELGRPLMPNRTARTVVVIVSCVVILMTYVFLAALGIVDEPGVQTFYLLLYLIPAALCTLLLSSTAISSEKETRSWPLLLTTTMTDAHILRAKVAGVLRRSWPVWAPLGGHVLLSMVFLCIHPLAVVHVLLLAAGTVALTLGLGMYFSARLRRTTTAMIVTIALLLSLWGGVPIVVGLTQSILAEAPGTGYVTDDGYRTRDLQPLHVLMGSGPITQAAVIADAATGDEGRSSRDLRYEWPFGDCDAGMTTSLIAFWAAVHLLAGTFLLWRAKARFRRDIF